MEECGLNGGIGNLSLLLILRNAWKIVISMRDRYLEVTFRKGKFLAAYLYLPRKVGEKSEKVEKIDDGILIDYGTDGHPIGIEITTLRQLNLESLNRILARLGVKPVHKEELEPLAVV